MKSRIMWMLILCTGFTAMLCLTSGAEVPEVNLAEFEKYASMKNTLAYATPSRVMVPKTTKDVQSAILYAKKNKLKPTIYSTGSSYIGRSTGDKRLMINFRLMKAITTDVSSSISDTGASITMEPGATFDMAYKKAHDAGYVIPGAAARGVSPTGCSLGGCHGWLTPSLGLLSDNVLAYTVVTANGSIVTMNSTHAKEENETGQVNTIDASDLFLALRGGGGAFAVITSITFKMHRPPSGGIAQLFCVWKYEAAEDVLAVYYSRNHPQKLGGSLTVRNPHDVHKMFGARGDVLLALIYYGPESIQSKAAFKPFRDTRPDLQSTCFEKPYKSFWDFHTTTWADPVVGMRSDRFSRFLKKEQFVTGVSDTMINKLNYASTIKLPMACTNTLLGGKVSQAPLGDSAISADYREAFAVMTCTAAWANDAAKHDRFLLDVVSGSRESFQGYGKGAYYNDPGFSVSNFEEEYFRGKYAKLLDIKKKYDPVTMFDCRQCVGGSSKANGLPPSSQLVILMSLLATLLYHK